MTVEQFSVMLPINDVIADDEWAMATTLSYLANEWGEMIRQHGGEPVGDPTITVEPNPDYGRPMLARNGGPLTGEDGAPILDRVKVHVRGVGRARKLVR